MKSTRRMRKLPFSYSNPRNDPTTNIEPNTASDLFCHALHSMYACITIKPTPELLILVSTATFLLIERFFTTILITLGKLSLQNWRHCNIHKPLPHTRQLTPAMTQVMTPARKRSVPSCIFTCSDLDKRANRLGFQPKSFTRRRLSRYKSHIGPALRAVPSYLRAQLPSTCISKLWLAITSTVIRQQLPHYSPMTANRDQLISERVAMRGPVTRFGQPLELEKCI